MGSLDVVYFVRGALRRSGRTASSNNVMTRPSRSAYATCKEKEKKERKVHKEIKKRKRNNNNKNN